MTAKSVKTHLNNAFPPGALTLLGPATSDTNGGTRFTIALINDLTKNGANPIRDRDFGWSHHNYDEVEQIGQTINALQAFFPPGLLQQFASVFYGPRTQQLRQILYGKWFGSGTSRDPDPRIWLTEGGARLEKLPPTTAPIDPNIDSPPSDP
ncbi:MAG: hypothetical protein M3071_18120 [Actinomycetota bacterium]|nr:hypothetical protein [Actinomycetota bacterium]